MQLVLVSLWLLPTINLFTKNEEQENLIESCKTPLDLAAVYYQTHKQGTYWHKYYERVYMLIEIIENF